MSAEGSDCESEASEGPSAPAASGRRRRGGTQRSLHDAFGGEAPQRQPKKVSSSTQTSGFPCPFALYFVLLSLQYYVQRVRRANAYDLQR